MHNERRGNTSQQKSHARGNRKRNKLRMFMYGDTTNVELFFLSNTTTTCPFCLPSRLWLKCNQLLRLGRTWCAVTLSR
jgi:hypothetical protein